MKITVLRQYIHRIFLVNERDEEYIESNCHSNINTLYIPRLNICGF